MEIIKKLENENEIIKKIENEYINLKEHFNTRKKELYSYLYAKFLINEDSINELVKYSSLKENIIFNKNKKNDSEYSAGLYAGAEKQAINTINKIISEYMKIHIKKARLDNIDLKDLINCLDFIVLINKANDFIFKYNCDINYAIFGYNHYEDYSEEYWVILQKDINDTEYEIAYLSYNEMIIDYKLNKDQKIKLREKCNIKIK